MRLAEIAVWRQRPQPCGLADLAQIPLMSLAGVLAGLDTNLTPVPKTGEHNERLGELDLLQALLDAYDVPDKSGDRQPIWYLRFHGDVMHHAFGDSPPALDEGTINELHVKGLIDVEYGGRDGNTWNLAPTSHARRVLAEHNRMHAEATADVTAVAEALERQQHARNPLAWPAVRPLLEALNGYWRESGYPAEGIGIMPIARAIPDEDVPLLAASLRQLTGSGYLTAGDLTGTLTDGISRSSTFPAEVAMTEKAHTVLDGWPGAAPSELAENLIAVISAAAASERDLIRKGRLEAFAAAVKDVGVGITSEVLAKVITGGAGLG